MFSNGCDLGNRIKYSVIFSNRKSNTVVYFIVLISYPMIFLASPMFEHKRGNIPLSIFGNPFVIIGTETRHCLHGSEKVHRIFSLIHAIIFLYQ